MKKLILLVCVLFTSAIFANFPTINIKPNLSCHGISEIAENKVIALLLNTKRNGVYLTAIGDTSFSFYTGKTASVGVNGYANIEVILKDHFNFTLEGEELWTLTSESIKGKTVKNLKGTISTWGKNLGDYDYSITCSGSLMPK